MEQAVEVGSRAQNGLPSGEKVMMPRVIVIGVRSSIHGNRRLVASISGGHVQVVGPNRQRRHVKVIGQSGHVVLPRVGAVHPQRSGRRIRVASSFLRWRSRMAGLSRSPGMAVVGAGGQVHVPQGGGL
ncbi:MAG: hypothetical protein CM1200mP2_23710 [Planctomycetaceae bacterium]|nr:MAG: hypothetical protein CM1200mP2_23710 [Planctomycetaceae bacterium]